MSSMQQFQMMELMGRVTEGKKSKNSASSKIWIGGITAGIAIAIIAFAVFMMSTANQNIAGATSVAGTAGCCTLIGIIFGIVGLVFLVIGWVGRNSASASITDAETEMRNLRMQIALKEDERSGPSK